MYYKLCKRDLKRQIALQSYFELSVNSADMVGVSKQTLQNMLGIIFKFCKNRYSLQNGLIL